MRVGASSCTASRHVPTGTGYVLPSGEAAGGADLELYLQAGQTHLEPGAALLRRARDGLDKI